MSPENIEKIPYFKHASAPFLQALSSHAVTQEHPKGKILFLSGEEIQRFFYVHSGWVKLYKETLDGEQAIIDILPAGHIFGDTAVFNDYHAHYSAEIVEDAKITTFPIKDLRHELESNNKLALHMMQIMSASALHQNNEIEHRTLQNAPQRIGCFILRLCPQTQEQDIEIRLPYDKTLIAARLGMQPETFSRALSKLSKATNISVRGATIHIPLISTLTDFVCTACSSEFPCKDLECSSSCSAL